jgi:ureidoacrylate peracid hydrolase
VLISDATASSNHKHYESTLENVKGYYGLVMDLEELSSYLPPSTTHETEPKMLRQR